MASVLSFCGMSDFTFHIFAGRTCPKFRFLTVAQKVNVVDQAAQHSIVKYHISSCQT